MPFGSISNRGPPCATGRCSTSWPTSIKRKGLRSALEAPSGLRIRRFFSQAARRLLTTSTYRICRRYNGQRRNDRPRQHPTTSVAKHMGSTVIVQDERLHWRTGRNLDPSAALPTRGPGDDSRTPVAREVVPSSVWFGPSLDPAQERELMAHLGASNGVAVLQWPRDRDRLDRLARLGLPRLLLVHPSVELPPTDGPLQLTLPYGAEDTEIHDALLGLCRQATLQRAAAGPPLLDGEGWVWAAGGRVELPPLEHRLAVPLVQHFGCPVGDDLLVEIGRFLSSSPTVVPASPSCSRRRLYGHLTHLCQLLNPLGLEVRSASDAAHVMRWCTSYVARH